MKLEEIRDEVRARGFHYVEPVSRIDGWINRAYMEICSRQPWPFLERVVSGPAPLEVPGVTSILYVTADGRELQGSDVRDVMDRDPGMARTGRPVTWYLTGDTIHVWPDWTGDLTVRCVAQPDLLAAGMEPVLPEAYQELLVEGAVLRALRDNDEYDAANGVQQIIEARVDDMTDALLHRNAQNIPGVMLKSRPWEDYLG